MQPKCQTTSLCEIHIAHTHRTCNRFHCLLFWYVRIKRNERKKMLNTKIYRQYICNRACDVNWLNVSISKFPQNICTFIFCRSLRTLNIQSINPKRTWLGKMVFVFQSIWKMKMQRHRNKLYHIICVSSDRKHITIASQINSKHVEFSRKTATAWLLNALTAQSHIIHFVIHIHTESHALDMKANGNK